MHLSVFRAQGFEASSRALPNGRSQQSPTW
jgi:hypothetical protein